MEEYNLNQTLEQLAGPTKEQVIVNNNWAAVALNRFHQNSRTEMEFVIHGESQKVILNWDSDFTKAAMREDKDMANHGGVAMAWFVMSVLLDYKYVEQSEIGDGVDYCFLKYEPSDDDLNFLSDFHYVEVSGILEESGSNTLSRRLKVKHDQINKGGKRNEPSSVIVSLFSLPKTIKEIHI